MFGRIRDLFTKKQPPVIFKYGVVSLEKEVEGLKGQLKVDNAEITNLKTKLLKVRQILGKDDLTFSRFTRSQIEEMSIEEFRKVEPEIDQDVADGKLFLR